MPSVLIVDRDLLSAKLARAVLEADGWYVLHAPDGDHARALLATIRPNLIVTALGPPLHAANNLVAELRAMTGVPIVAVTALGFDLARNAIEAGCSGFVAKPIDISTFSAQLRSYLGG